MKRIPVISSNVAELGHWADCNVLEVKYKNQAIYRFQGVGQALFEEILHAESIGGTLAAKVQKFPKIHPAEKVWGPIAPSALTITDAVIELLSEESRWCQRYPCYDAQRQPCPVDHPQAARWCIVGAYLHFQGILNVGPVLEESALDLTDLNDTHSHGEVMGKLKQIREGFALKASE